MLTIPEKDITLDNITEIFEKTEEIHYMRGQQEMGTINNFLHWQIIVYFKKKITCPKCKSFFPSSTHVEPTRSKAAKNYVWKEETSIPNTKFELGEMSLQRNEPTDWARVRRSSIDGDFVTIPDDIFLRYYHSIRSIYKDFAKPIMRSPQEVFVFWGPPGTGKTRRVFEEVGSDGWYIKSPTTKWWDGYNGEETIILDEFRGDVHIAHLLRWLDRYPCTCEIKGAQLYLNTKRWYITSNISYTDWYKDIDNDTLAALKRRLTMIVHFPVTPFTGNVTPSTPSPNQ